MNRLNQLDFPMELDFPVEVLHSGQVLNINFKAADMYFVTNMQDQTIYKPVSNKYKPVTFKEQYEMTINLLEEHKDVDTSNMEVIHYWTENKGRYRFRILLPEMIIEPEVGDKIRNGLQGDNSYDLSSVVRVITKGERLICKNGMTTSDHTMRIARKHTKRLDMTKEYEKISNGVSAFYDSEGIYQRWMATYVAKNKVEDLFKNTLAKNTAKNVKHKYNGKQFTYLMDDWDRQIGYTGRNLWSTYNVATAWATKSVTQRGGNQLALNQRLEDSVASMLNSTEWKELNV
tara:strand:+ start:1576 stop:2439 length:864 start_codon:yes stop_codon:yes gene_type:complete